MTENDVKCPKVTGIEPKGRHFTGNHLQVAVEDRKQVYSVDFASYKAVVRRRMQSHDRK